MRPFVRAEVDPSSIARVVAQTGLDPMRVRTQMGDLWINDIYQVGVRCDPATRNLWLSIKRIDKEPIFSQADMQSIKDELVGHDCEGVELFPAESRLVDSANQYHLWATTDSTVRLMHGAEATLDGVAQSQIGKFAASVRRAAGGFSLIELRLDEGRRDWREVQDAKNQAFGAECEAVQIYPARERLGAPNTARLWVCHDPQYRFPFGFKARMVGERSIAGSKQRSFER